MLSGLYKIFVTRPIFVTTVFFRNVIFFCHRFKTLLLARVAHAARLEENLRIIEMHYAMRNNDIEELVIVQQFVESFEDGFWPYFCRTFYIYAATRVFRKAVRWAKTCNEYHSERGGMYEFFCWLLVSLTPAPVYVPKRPAYGWRFRFRRIYFRLIMMPDIIINVMQIRLITIAKDATAPLHNRLKEFYKQKKDNFLIKKITYTSFLMFFILTTIAGLLTINTVTAVWFVTNMAIAMPAALLWQTFVFFQKTYQLGKYTTQNQRFWKRALMLFWSIEGFLFLIVLFIWIIAPSNLKVTIDHQQIINSNSVSSEYLFTSVIYPTILLILYRALLFFKTAENGLMSCLVLYVSIVFVSWILVIEFCQLLNVYNRSSNITQIFVRKNYGLSNELAALSTLSYENLVNNQVKFLIVFLKFWHILFIAVFMQFKLLRFLDSGTNSFESISAGYYNLLYLFYFNIATVVFFFKNYWYFLVEAPTYYYFITNPTGALWYLICNTYQILYWSFF